MDGFHENTVNQRNFLHSLKKPGQTIALDLASRNGTQGCESVAMRHMYPNTTEQRCWVHKMVNTEGAIPQPLNEKVNAGLQEICLATTRQEAIALLVKTRGIT